MNNIMQKAWQIAKRGQQNFGGSVKEYFPTALKMAWALFKKSERASMASIVRESRIETMYVEKAMSEKNPTVKKMVEEGWTFKRKEWSKEKNMYIATLERTVN